MKKTTEKRKCGVYSFSFRVSKFFAPFKKVDQSGSFYFFWSTFIEKFVFFSQKLMKKKTKENEKSD